MKAVSSRASDVSQKTGICCCDNLGWCITCKVAANWLSGFCASQGAVFSRLWRCSGTPNSRDRLACTPVKGWSELK